MTTDRTSVRMSTSRSLADVARADRGGGDRAEAAQPDLFEGDDGERVVERDLGHDVEGRLPRKV